MCATSNAYYNPKHCTFSVTSTPTHTLLPIGAQGLYAHSVCEIWNDKDEIWAKLK